MNPALQSVRGELLGQFLAKCRLCGGAALAPSPDRGAVAPEERCTPYRAARCMLDWLLDGDGTAVPPPPPAPPDARRVCDLHPDASVAFRLYRAMCDRNRLSPGSCRTCPVFRFRSAYPAGDEPSCELAWDRLPADASLAPVAVSRAKSPGDLLAEKLARMFREGPPDPGGIVRRDGSPTA